MKIKICGIRRLIDIEYVNELKPDYIGFVFAESKRRITLNEAKILKENLNKDILAVGVFRNQTIDEIMNVIDAKVIDIIQLHGDETKDYIMDLQSKTNLKIIKAYQEFESIDYVLIDSINPGSGIKENWEIKDYKKKVFLAGGVNISNIEEAINLNPYAIDISSGVESGGFKDYKKMEEIIRRVRK